MKKTLLISALALCFGLFQALPAKAENIFFDDMETGANGWTSTGFWHQITNPENISVSSALNPDLISLPDDGSLPSAYSGSTAWWYGEDATGTYIGAYNTANQTAKNGGLSNEANTGYLMSPAIDLSAQTNATLEFATWWEIEGVDVNTYDMMYVQASTDGVNFTELDSINPINDVNGESFKPYTSGGLGQAGQWVDHTFSLDSYAGGTVYIRFYFDSRDYRYNAFRGWFVDDVAITNEGTSEADPDFSTNITAEQSCGDWGIQLNGGTFELLKSQTVSISLTDAAGFWINSYGTNKVVASGTADNTVLLPKGKYVIFPMLNGDCPSAAAAYADVDINNAAPIPNVVQSGGFIDLYGNNFTSSSLVYFVLNGVETAASEVAAIGNNQIEITLPYLTAGLYNIKVVNGSQSTVLKNALTVTTDYAPTLSSVSPETIVNDVDNVLTVSGFYIENGAKVMIGDFPCLNATVASDGYSLTCTAPKGMNAGYLNITVQNPDGQVDTLVGELSVTDNTEEMFSLNSGTIAYINQPVKRVRLASRGTTRATVTFKRIKKSKKGYQLEIRKSDDSLVKRVRTKKKFTANTKLIKGLKTQTNYKVRVRAINKKGYSVVWSDYKTFKTK
ncbi:MAG: IPT/TIG domain-containing protein [Patescibacteria group bacterium]|jgi:hypothetical protein